MNNIRSTFSSLREYLTPISHSSTFKETGEITPEEFVAAGDYLAYKFPTWDWAPVADSALEKGFLPLEKQFLVTRKIPSFQRALTYLNAGDDEDAEVDEDGWTTTHVHRKIDTVQKPAEEIVNEQEIQDIDSDEFEEDLDPVEQGHKRNYDLYISYSTSYRVPKMYLVGFDSNGIPLTPEQMFEDISSDYRDKTATIEKAPFLVNTTSVSIHPCRHATVMKVLMNRAQAAAQEQLNSKISKLGLKDNDDEWENIDEEQGQDVVRVDQYLVIFLKFIASVTPGINHDYTMDAF